MNFVTLAKLLLVIVSPLRKKSDEMLKSYCRISSSSQSKSQFFFLKTQVKGGSEKSKDDPVSENQKLSSR